MQCRYWYFSITHLCLVLLCDQNSFGRSKMVLVWPNWFGLDHYDLVTTKMKWSQPKWIGRVQIVIFKGRKSQFLVVPKYLNSLTCSWHIFPNSESTDFFLFSFNVRCNSSIEIKKYIYFPKKSLCSTFDRKKFAKKIRRFELSWKHITNRLHVL